MKERNLSCRNFLVRIQHNPRRLKSCTAGASSGNETEQPCFLCLHHLPEAQKGILYRGEYLILCNPMPILPSHLTVSHVNHRSQAIEKHITAFLELMRDLGPGWTVLYNGPKCGASVPDHLHFQTARSGQMPIETELQEKNRLALLQERDGVLLYRVRDFGREVIVLEGSNPSAMEGTFKHFLTALKYVLSIQDEPMINVLGFCDEKKCRLIVFPRRKHRPDAFFKKGKDRVVVSPGAIDMGGLMIAPLEKDFERLDVATVESIYREVSLDSRTIEGVMSAWTQHL